jgi:hypothetical protein
MKTLRAFFSRFAGIFRKDRSDRELADEMESHLQLHIDDNLRAGMSPAQALREAIMKLGGIEQTKEAYRDRKGLPMLETVLQDLRYGVRMMRKNPGFTCIAVLTLALGIGANTAIFSVINAVLFRPLPVTAPQELVDLYNASAGEMFNYLPLAYPDYIDFRDNNKTLTGLLGFAPNFVALEQNGESEMITVEAVTGNYFDVLGVKPLLGRTFDATQDSVAGGYSVVVLSCSMWERKFNADPAIVGKAVRLNGNILTIIGVAPRDFLGLMRGVSPGLWLPVTMDPILHLGDPLLDRGSQWLFVSGRLKPGVSAPQAGAELKTIADRLALQYPKSNKDRGAEILPASQVKIIPEVDSSLSNLVCHSRLRGIDSPDCMRQYRRNASGARFRPPERNRFAPRARRQPLPLDSAIAHGKFAALHVGRRSRFAPDNSL